MYVGGAITALSRCLIMMSLEYFTYKSQPTICYQGQSTKPEHADVQCTAWSTRIQVRDPGMDSRIIR